MTLPRSTIDRERQKFVEDASGNVAIRFIASPGTSVLGKVYLTDGTEDAAINPNSRLEVDLEESSLDLMLGTDFSAVLGTTSLISATPALKVEEQGTVAVTGTFWQTTQPISGTVTANAGTNLNTSSLALEATQATQSSFDHGSNLDVDTSAEQMTSTSFAAKKGVTIKADEANDGIIYVGNSDVTVSGTVATDGIPISAGEAVTLEVNNPNLIYVIASAENQKCYWVAV